jgi:hypothetical protein
MVIPEEHALAGRDQLRMADLEGCPLATGALGANDANFEMTYGPFREAGMVLRPVAEGKVAIGHYAGRERLFMLSYGDAQEAVAELRMVTRPVVDTTSRVEVWAYRNGGDERALVRRLWSFAGDLSKTAPS